jgi:rfaE bifunctional protein nucleotidyltransferase chain/domain
MINKVINQSQAAQIATGMNLKNKSIVVVGGCFDILHEGHFKYLEESKRYGDILMLLLESDQNIKTKKGPKRPINNQAVRAENLSKLPFLDYIIALPEMTKDSDYDTLLSQINPKVISATKGDKEIIHKERSSKKLNAKLVLIEKWGDFSTSGILKTNGNYRHNKI